MKLNILKVLRGAATIASVTGGSPLGAVIGVVNALTSEKVTQVDREASPIDETVVSALHVATQAAQSGHADPLSLVMTAVDLVHPPASGTETATPLSPVAALDPDRAKVLADRRRLADGMTRIQALIAQMKARKG